MIADDDGLWVAEASVSAAVRDCEASRKFVEDRLRAAFTHQTGHDRMTDPVWREEWHHPENGPMFLMWNVSVQELPPEPS